MVGGSLAPELWRAALTTVRRPNGPRRQPAPARAAIGAHVQAALRACLDELPDRYRSVLWLVEVEQRPIPEVAAVLDLSISLTTARVERARHMLARTLCGRLRVVECYAGGLKARGAEKREVSRR